MSDLRVQKILEESHDDMIAFAQRLIRLPSVTGEEKEVADAILETLEL